MERPTGNLGWTIALLATLAASGPAFAQSAPPPTSVPAAPVRKAIADLPDKEHCEQLVAFFDRYGSSRIQDSDGMRNHFRIRAAIDCERGQCSLCVHDMEVLLVRKAFDIPRFVGAAPFFEPSGRTPLGPAP